MFSLDEPPINGDEEVYYDDQGVRAATKSRTKLMPQIMTKVRLPSLIYPSSMYKYYDELNVINSEKDVLKHALVRIQLTLLTRSKSSYLIRRI